MKKIYYIFIPLLSSFIGFILHVYFTEFFSSYIEDELKNISVSSSWDVKYLAAITSIETGFGIIILYHFIHKSLPSKSSFYKGIILWLLLLAIMGRLVRQPLMDYAIGNTAYVALLQNISSWLVWFFICTITAVLYDKLLFNKEN